MVDVVERTAKVKRFFGKNGDGSDNTDIWADIEMFLTIVTEEGSGVDFIRKGWTFDWESTLRETDTLKLYDPNDDSAGAAYIPIPIPRSAVLEHGSGVDYQAERWEFENDETNDNRETTVYRVKHTEQDGTVDDTQYLDAEQGDVFLVHTGSGVDFMRFFYHMDNSKVPDVVGLGENKYTLENVSGEWTMTREVHDRSDTFTSRSVGVDS